MKFFALLAIVCALLSLLGCTDYPAEAERYIQNYNGVGDEHNAVFQALKSSEGRSVIAKASASNPYIVYDGKSRIAIIETKPHGSETVHILDAELISKDNPPPGYGSMVILGIPPGGAIDSTGRNREIHAFSNPRFEGDVFFVDAIQGPDEPVLLRISGPANALKYEIVED